MESGPNLETFKVKEKPSSRRHVVSDPSQSNRGKRKKYHNPRQRGRPVNIILQGDYSENHETKSPKGTEGRGNCVVETSRPSLGTSFTPTIKKTCVLTGMDSQFVTSNSAPSSIHPLDLRPSHMQSKQENVAIIGQSLPLSSMKESPSPSEPPRDAKFDPRTSENSAFWREWSNIAQRRASILTLRSNIHELRGTLREKQHLKSATEDRLIQCVLQRELSTGVVQNSVPPKSILELVHDCQTTRDDYGPCEDECTNLEDRLYRDEFFLHRLEEQFYTRWSVVPGIHGDMRWRQFQDEPSPLASIDFHNEQVYDDDPNVSFHPMVEKYLSRKGDLNILKEQFHDFEERLDFLDEDQESLECYGRLLDSEDQEFQANSYLIRDKLLGQIQQTEDEVNELRRECFTMKLVDELGEPTDPESQKWREFEVDEEIDTRLEESAYSKFSELIVPPALMSQDLAQISTHHAPEDTNILQVITNTFDQVEFWMLMILRCSAINVNLLLKFSDLKGVVIGDSWQQRVLDTWFKDNVSESKSKSVSQYKIPGLTTQAAALRNESSNSYPNFTIKVPILGKSHPSQTCHSLSSHRPGSSP
jgi:hypothetical protein